MPADLYLAMIPLQIGKMKKHMWVFLNSLLLTLKSIYNMWAVTEQYVIHINDIEYIVTI